MVIFTISLTTQGQDRISGKTYSTRSEVIAQQGMAATSQPLATQVALDILKKEVAQLMQLLRLMHY